MHDLNQLGTLLPASWTLVTPRAPNPGMPWGYGPGWAWYRYLEEDRVVDESLGKSLEALEDFLQALPERLGRPVGPLVLGGFSQGGTMATAYALTHPGEVPLVLNLSGFMVKSPIVSITPTSVAGTEFFWGHGEADPAIPHSLARKGRKTLEGVNARLTSFDHPGGHTITGEEIQEAIDWIQFRTGFSRPT